MHAICYPDISNNPHKIFGWILRHKAAARGEHLFLKPQDKRLACLHLKRKRIQRPARCLSYEQNHECAHFLLTHPRLGRMVAER